LIGRNVFKLTEQQAVGNCRFLQQLLNGEVTKMTFAELQFAPSSILKSVSDAWVAMSTQCPRPRSLVCDNFFMPDRLENFFRFALSFKNLQVLTVTNLECDDARLTLLAQHLQVPCSTSYIPL
jgi:hypothetical protein